MQISTWDASMTEGTLVAWVRTQRWMGHRYNGYLVFDYLDEENFKYAGVWEGANRWVIREVADGEGSTCATTEEPIHRLVLYELEVVVEGDRATLVVDGEEKVSCDFGPGGIHGGKLGSGLPMPTLTSRRWSCGSSRGCGSTTTSMGSGWRCARMVPCASLPAITSARPVR